MKFPGALTQAVLLKRVKRFLAEVIINNIENKVIYCPNLGVMRNCDLLGSRIWFSYTPRRRRMPFTWELIEVDGGDLVCINPQWSLPLVMEGIEAGTIPELSRYTKMTPAPDYLEEHYFDLVLEKPDSPEGLCFISSHSVTLGDEVHRGFYPEGRTEKGVRQLRALIRAKELGHRSVLIYCVLHSNIDRVFPADHIDVQYGYMIRQALKAGVEVMAYGVSISLEEMRLNKSIEVCIPPRLLFSPRL